MQLLYSNARNLFFFYYLNLKLRLFILFVTYSIISIPLQNAFSQDSVTVNTPRFTLHINADRSSGTFTTQDAQKIATKSISILNKTYDEIGRIFGVSQQHPVVLRFLSPIEFTRETGAPSWTSAMFFRGEITIPLTNPGIENLVELENAIRHEYVHAIVAELSDYKCPAWIDEGLAQLIEGKPNPLLGPALRKWISYNQAMPLPWLENGFTTLNESIVPAAYAESLFATRSLINIFGIRSITRYLDLLKNGKDPSDAFALAFNQTLEDFESQLTPQIKMWARSKQESP